MNKLTIAIIIAGACIAGCVGGAIATMLINQAQVVQAQAKPVPVPPPAPPAPIKIAIINLEKACRNEDLFNARKLKYEAHQKDVNDKREARRRDLDTLRERLREYQATNKPDEAAAVEVEIKAKEQEIEFADDFYKHYLAELRDKFLRDVLQKVYDTAKTYCERNGYHMLLQDYALGDAKTDDLFAGKMWSETLMNKPVLFVDRIDPKAPRPNEYITDITDLIK
ncbi:MAG: OmpH family outer membrane protein [Planctomycetes bacterium]|nr:OmpH family outer membrane protein [Planctomycetota bacterium]